MRVIPTTNPRRRPRQARAQATVEAIVKATSRVLIEEGYDRASTNRIAHAAGVSIGSLYQYFPSKEALVACRRQLFSVDDRLRLHDVDRAVFMLVHAIPSVVRAAIQADPSGAADETLASDLTDMIVRYLSNEPAELSAHAAE